MFETIVKIMAIGVIIAQVSIVVTLLFWVLPNKKKIVKRYFEFLKNNAFLFSFVVALGSLIGSLFFSDVAALLPCELCWKQRIFLFPQAFLFGVAVWKKEKVIADYSIVLSIIGILYSIYHYTLQMLPIDLSNCASGGFLSNCSEKLIFEFGYITIPMMSMTAFALLLLFMLIHKFYKN